MTKYYRLSQMEFSASNIFEFDDPQAYDCRVWAYSKGHSVLVICVMKKDADAFEPLFLVFDAVHYFEGTFWWTGANFQTASREEYADLVIKLQPKYSLPKEMWLSPELPALAGHLFIVHTETIDIKFWAHHLTITDDSSEWLQFKV